MTTAGGVSATTTAREAGPSLLEAGVGVRQPYMPSGIVVSTTVSTKRWPEHCIALRIPRRHRPDNWGRGQGWLAGQLLRAELDALPMAETMAIDYASERPGGSHKCSRDGRAAMVAGVGRALASSPLARGPVVLLFQPAEETGEGAARVLADSRSGSAIARGFVQERPLGELAQSSQAIGERNRSLERCQ